MNNRNEDYREFRRAAYLWFDSNRWAWNMLVDEYICYYPHIAEGWGWSEMQPEYIGDETDDTYASLLDEDTMELMANASYVADSPAVRGCIDVWCILHHLSELADEQ